MIIKKASIQYDVQVDEESQRAKKLQQLEALETFHKVTSSVESFSFYCVSRGRNDDRETIERISIQKQLLTETGLSSSFLDAQSSSAAGWFGIGASLVCLVSHLF